MCSIQGFGAESFEGRQASIWQKAKDASRHGSFEGRRGLVLRVV